MVEKDKSTQKGSFILVLVAMLLGVLIGLMCANTFGRQPEAVPSKMGEVMDLVQENYVDRIDVDSLSEDLVRVMLTELDPHSTYLSAREAQRSAELMRGNFDGVGLIIHREGDTSYVGQVMPDGPSAGSGLQAGDMLATIDGDSIVGLPADSVVARLRGPRHTSVVVGVQRYDASMAKLKSLTYKLRRGVVAQRSLPCYTMIDDTTGYILLTSFTATSHDEFREALRSLVARGMRHLVFDLRGNSGGSLQTAVGIAGELLPMGSLIVYTQGVHSRRHNVRSHGGGLFTRGRVTVIIDENSASASEVVAGALQDNDRATVVGRRSFGKGLVQTEFNLDDGSSVLLTTARYYTPSGRCIQRSYDDGTDEYYRDYVQQLIDEAYADSAVATIRDTTPYYTVGGRTVYGGGGINPDHLFLYPHDTSFVYYNQLVSRRLLSTTAFAYVRTHGRELLERYPDAESFYQGFRVSDALIEELVRRGERMGVARDPKSLRAQRGLMANTMAAFIGQALYDDALYYRIILREDDDIKKIKRL
ncbi:MAG: S41 family peptidase [Bacteroidales bacterium]|nr:S41 family peptidase [Bacteroidales bacterium]